MSWFTSISQITGFYLLTDSGTAGIISTHAGTLFPFVGSTSPRFHSNQEKTMPYLESWIDPEVRLTHNGVKIYHTYRDDDYNQGANIYYFTTNGTDDDAEFHFDVRELPVPSAALLNIHPPSKSSDEYKKGSPTRIAEIDAAWEEYHSPDGSHQKAIDTVIREAIDRYLIRLCKDEGETQLSAGITMKGSLSLNGQDLTVDFTVEHGASQEQIDSAFLAALAQHAVISINMADGFEEQQFSAPQLAVNNS
jgi:hypothetical protein